MALAAVGGMAWAGEDTLAADSSQPAVEPRPVATWDVSYTGALLSAFIPGGGQFYHGRYVWGGVFLAAEVTAAGVTAYWWDESRWFGREAGRMRDSAAVAGERGAEAGDSAALYRSGLYAVIADKAEFEARQAKYTAYNALAWAIGIHIYTFMDALELGGLTPRGLEKNTARAGLLAAVPFLGLGQLYNERPSKAGMIAMSQISLAVMACGSHRLMNRASDKYNQMRDPETPQHAYRAEYLSYWKARYDKEFSNRNTYLWISLFVYLYSIFDAVVDAHLSDYEEKIRLGPDLAVGNGGVSYGIRVEIKR